jgi:hypothetical protein
VVEVDDPDVSITIDGEEMVITGAGAKEIRLKPGQYKVLATKDGQVLQQELVIVTREGRQVVRVSKEAGSTSESAGVATDADRRAAEWVLSVGGSIRVAAKGVETSVTKDGKLPDGPFHVTRVDLQETHIADADLANLKALANLKSLSIGHFFGNKNLTDAGIEHLLGLTQLEELIATGANITDDGLERLTSLKKLQVLYIPRTLVTNDGLRHLQKFPDLRHAGLSFTRVSDDGLSHLENLTNLEILNLEATSVCPTPGWSISRN